MVKKTNRWIVLIVSILMNICIGSAYAWSVFQISLIEHLNSSTKEVSLAFTINLALIPIAMIIFGKFQDKKGPKIVTLIGSIVFGVGLFLAGFSNSVAMLYISYGVLGGFGIGAVYGCTIANTVKWFPDKRGLAGGLVAGGFGSGAVILAPLGAKLVDTYGVLNTFRLMGVVFFIIIALCSLIIKEPKPGWVPENWTPPARSKTSINSGKDFFPSEMVKTLKFYILWVIYTLGLISGLMIIGHASPIAQEQIGLSPNIAAISVSIIAVANTTGRILWGNISDRLGRYNSIVLMFGISALMLVILNISTSTIPFLISASGIALSFGGFLGIMPSITADKFGSRNLGINYGVLFTAFGVAAVIGPRIAAIAKETNNGIYSTAYFVSIGLNILGIICTLYMMRITNKENSLIAE